MAPDTPYLRAVIPSLPRDIAQKVRALCGSTSDSSAEYVLDTLVRFISGAECSPSFSDDARAEWSEKQQVASNILRDMIRPNSTGSKRAREDELEPGSKSPKRQKSSEDATQPQGFEDAIYTLHSVSTTSPIRKKVDITIHKTFLRFTHPNTHAVEATIPISTLTRAFLLPTRGKSKAHWTVVILSSDTSESPKPPNSTQSNQQQAIFGVDALTTSSWSTTTHLTPSANPVVLPKGSPTRPALLSFLSRLGVSFFEPKPDVFKSACAGITAGVSASEDGIPGVEAYRGAKQGSLWFMKEGILWGESKPCEFWAVEDLIGKSEGLRVVGANGRTFSVILTRKSQGDGEEVGDDEEDVGVETQFGLVDSKERSGIEGWVKSHRHLFGQKQPAGSSMTIKQIENDSDDEDEDFEMDSDDIGSASSSASDSDERDEDGSGDDDDAEGEGSDDAEADEDEELKEENHPLLRPGAVPRMSRAVVDMVVGMVEEDMMGSVGGAAGDQGSEDELEEDELDD